MSELEIIKSITFFGFSFLTVLFALLTVFSLRILYSLLFAVIAFFCAGGVFFSLGADYNAVVQIALYGVAVPVIFLFAIMLTSKKENKTVYIAFIPRFIIAFCSAVLLIMLIWYSVEFALHLSPDVAHFFNPDFSLVSGFNSISLIAGGLYLNYQVAFIMLAFLVLTVIIGFSVLNVIKERRRG